MNSKKKPNCRDLQFSRNKKFKVILSICFFKKNSIYSTSFMEQFENILNQLNAAQKLAVESIEGPVMVIAGPGTGKTQILAARILSILQQTDTRPENILCLTYTEAGALAMQKRLSQFLGSNAYRVNIHTFHGLCNKIINEFPEEFSKRDLRVMDDLERIDIIQQIIEELPAESLLKDYNENSSTKRVQFMNLWNILREQNLTPSQIFEWVDEISTEQGFLEAFPEMVYKRSTGTAVKGDIKRSEYDTHVSNWKKLKEAVQLYDRYAELKAKNGVYEFQDMLTWVEEKLKNDFSFKLMIQEKYQYVLVDEYQDTSELQNAILYHLIDFWEDNPNCFVVGDDDQSIYAFQGAQLKNMLTFHDRFRNYIQTIVLTDNYRSSQEILDYSARLIKHNQARLVNEISGLSKILKSAGANALFPSLHFNICQYTNEFHEVLGVTETIERLIAQNHPPEDIAIIYSKHKHAETYISLFKEKNIPFVLNKKINILQEPIIQLLLDWLEYLDKETNSANSGEHLLYSLLMSDLYEIEPITLNRISVDIIEKKRIHYNQNLPIYTWREHLYQTFKYPEQYEDRYGKKNLVILEKLWNSIELWIKRIQTENIIQIISDLYTDGGFIAQAVAVSNSNWNLEVLHSFLSFVTDQSNRRPYLTLTDLMSIINKMIINDLTVNLEKRLGTGNGVQFLTAHGSKGLEFEHVFIINANADEWEKGNNSMGNFKLLKLLEGKGQLIKNDQTSEQSLEEKRRLFYVAMTRAKKSLHISFNQNKVASSKTENLPARFLSEIDPELFSKKVAIQELNSENLGWALLKSLQLNSKPKLINEDIDWLKQRVDEFVFSPSSIKTIMECGLAFYYGNLIKVPQSTNENLSFGNAIHGFMRELVQRIVKKGISMSEIEAVQMFDYHMSRFRGGFSRKQFELRHAQGLSLIPLILNQKLTEYTQYHDVKTEFSIQSRIRNVQIKGMIDKVILDGDRAIISDYKTGKLKNIELKSKAPNYKKEDSFPPAYWFQTAVYALMINYSQENTWKCSEGLIEALEPDENRQLKDLKLYFSKEDFELVESWIVKADEKLKSLSFLEGCGKPDCQWCNFSKKHELVMYEED